jgi:hypothetical protein
MVKALATKLQRPMAVAFLAAGKMVGLLKEAR